MTLFFTLGSRSLVAAFCLLRAIDCVSADGDFQCPDKTCGPCYGHFPDPEPVGDPPTHPPTDLLEQPHPTATPIIHLTSTPTSSDPTSTPVTGQTTGPTATSASGPTTVSTSMVPVDGPTAGPTMTPTGGITAGPTVASTGSPTAGPSAGGSTAVPTMASSGRLVAGPTAGLLTCGGSTSQQNSVLENSSAVHLDAQIILKPSGLTNESGCMSVVEDMSPTKIRIELHWESSRRGHSRPEWTEENPVFADNSYDAHTAFVDTRPIFDLTRTNLVLMEGMINCSSTAGDWTLMFAGKALTNPAYTNAIILGPGGRMGNNQLRYEAGNTLAIYAIPGPFWSPGIRLPFPTTEFHVLALVYDSSQGHVSIYQNGELVTVIDKRMNGEEPFELAFRTVGCWFGGKYQSSLGFHRLIKLNTTLTAEQIHETSYSIAESAGIQLKGMV